MLEYTVKDGRDTAGPYRLITRMLGLGTGPPVYPRRALKFTISSSYIASAEEAFRAKSLGITGRAFQVRPEHPLLTRTRPVLAEQLLEFPREQMPEGVRLLDVRLREESKEWAVH